MLPAQARQFSTQFNFGDHVGRGRKFGDEGRDEVELRAGHCSNGGYRKPNPGENRFQWRYMHWFRELRGGGRRRHRRAG